MDTLKETVKSICDDFADINAMLAARSRELDRRAAFDKEISRQIKSILNKNSHENIGRTTADEP